MPTSHDAALLARLGFRAPDRALRDVPGDFSSERRWPALLALLGEAPDPDGALQRLTALGPQAVERALADPARARPLVAALGFSQHLASLIARTPGLASEVVSGERSERGEIRAFKDAELTHIAAHDLAAPPTRECFERTGRALSALADACLERTLGSQRGFAVLAMGKYGGRELNYASDIDVLFVYRNRDHEEAERLARDVMSSMSGLFRVDANLRPEGRDGPLARSLDSYASYYGRWAQVWEFQSLIKCRFAAGDAGLGRDFVGLVEPFVWPERLAPEAIEQVRALKARVESEVERRGLARRQVKLGPGGIRDVEFAVQLLQLVHGRHHPQLRLPATLDALDALGAEGFVAEPDAAALADAYVFLRHTEHRLQLVGGRQTHTLPAKESAREHLARGMGYRDEPKRSALVAFEAEWRSTTSLVRQIHERLFYRPLLETFAAAPAVTIEDARERLAALGFDRPERAQGAIAELVSGASRRAKVMRAILPGLLSWLSETPDPDAGLVRLRDLVPALEAMPHLLTLLRDSPPVAELLCRALGTGPVLAELLWREPGLVSALEPAERPSARDALVHEATSIAARATTTTTVRRFKDGEWLRTATRDLGTGGTEGFVEAGRRLAHLADACLEAALVMARSEQDARTGGPPPGGFAVVGMGRLGGEELNHQSDLDVLFVYEVDGDCPNGWEGRLYHSAVSERVAEILSSSPPIFRVDTELRPEGRKGPIVRSLESHARYYERWADAWEFQALARARHSAGDPAVTAALLDRVGARVWPAELADADVNRLRHIKARIERERVKATEDARYQVKLGVGGLADVEFTVQLLQRRHGHAHPELRVPNTLAAVEGLKVAELLDRRDAAWLHDAYLLLNRVRNHLFLLRGVVTDSLPSRDEDLERLARSLGYGRLARSQFLEDYRRATRRARRVCDRLFYGED